MLLIYIGIRIITGAHHTKHAPYLHETVGFTLLLILLQFRQQLKIKYLARIFCGSY